MKKLLLHSCCGPCSTAVIERLRNEYDISVIFYNPNITDEEEYIKRKENQIKVIKTFDNVDIIDDDYKPNDFFEITKGYEKEKEGGKRCSICFSMRLKETAKIGKEKDYDIFGTTLSVSPHKDYKRLSIIGNSISKIVGIEFLDENFKKKDGYKRSIDISKELGLYRQRYCGCEFSKWFDE